MKRIVIVGTGVAGLSVARALPPNVECIMLCKSHVADGATALAQGGIAVAIGKNDSTTLHATDTLRAGHYANNPNTVLTVVQNAQNRLSDLISIGFQPDRKTDGSLDLGLEGGHSVNRIVHARDSTGRHIHEVLLTDVMHRPWISIQQNTIAIHLLMKDASVSGVEVIDEHGNEYFIEADAVVLATGGIGALHVRTTNPPSATGDGLKLALEAGARLSNIDKIQWHPTALYVEDQGTSCMPLITEALRGAGAELIDADGNDVVPISVDIRGCLAPRDVVTKACLDSMKRSNDKCVFLDATHIGAEILSTQFPNVVAACVHHGIDPVHQLIPVVPAVHYLCGGVTADTYGQTNVSGLYAVGECADTGLHGDNRLASNSLLEGLVVGSRCGWHIGAQANSLGYLWSCSDPFSCFSCGHARCARHRHSFHTSNRKAKNTNGRPKSISNLST